MRIGRNELCPCGSRKKFKHCHGLLGSQHDLSPFDGVVRLEMRDVLATRAAEQTAFEAKHGSVKEVIAAELSGYRFVATGKTLHFAKEWKLFTDFLGGYLGGLLGAEWGAKQVMLQWHLL